MLSRLYVSINIKLQYVYNITNVYANKGDICDIKKL